MKHHRVQTSGAGLDQDTIAAIATPPGKGGISIVRMSGPQAWTIAQALTTKTIAARQPSLCDFYSLGGEPIDQGLAVLFRAPASFTGEDVAELHGHGGTVVSQMLLRACLDRGARLARPGEFSERAFLNDKLDLAQAEGLADLIDAPTQQAAKQAAASLRGDFSAVVNAIEADLINLRVFVEAAIDFPEEEVDFLSDRKIAEALEGCEDRLKTLISEARQGALMGRGAKIVLTGQPNAGKSSVMNRLAKDAIAIVTDIPGTTRDVIRQSIDLSGVAVQLADTAGIREAKGAIEREGVNRALAELKSADLIIEVIDDSVSSCQPTHYAPGIPVISAFNKIDLSHRSAGTVAESDTAIAISATNGAGFPELVSAILVQLGFDDGSPSTPFSARERHIHSLQRAQTVLTESMIQYSASGAGELLAEDLRKVHEELAAITGSLSADDLLGEIFTSFCIGK
ncbi:MAG: tRNA uridine-5-carboxymethylaminomethyl(34) synthesis GTPase MnmE [Luminiphilus sp.]|nr:tRNA uridine-5-carboxymethylaminomethyl(34) synthesis GTPase MnmE [Luminiphilus sp.]